MVPETHLAIDARLCGEPLDLEEGRARVRLVAVPEMGADGRGLVHGGFLFGLADYAAMLAVNDPNVVLGSADVRFVKPVQVGDEVIAEARVSETAGRKHVVHASVLRGADEVFRGTFTCFVLDTHPLDR